MHPTFAQFVAALRTPPLRMSIGLSISDDDASRLLANDAWAQDYYRQWVELFPTSPDPATLAAPRGPRVAPAVIIGSLIAACVAVAVVALLLPRPSPEITAAADHHPESSLTPTPTASNGAGLTAAEVELFDSQFALAGTSLDKLEASGTTVAQVRALAKVETGLSDLLCTQYGSLPHGFDAPGVKEKVVAAWEKGIPVLGKTVTPTPVQAERIWTAIVGYCGSKSPQS